MTKLLQLRLAPAVISSAILVFAEIWFVSAWVFHVTNSNSKDGVFGAPLWSLGILLSVPLVGLVLGWWLVRERRAQGRKLGLIDYAVLMAGVAPALFVGGSLLLGLLVYAWEIF